MAGFLKFAVIALVMVAWVTSGCAATKQARTVEKLGFLKDLYPLMSHGNEEEGESLLLYRNPKVRSIPKGSYTKFMLDPVLIFRSPESKMRGIPQNQAQLMADTFYALIYQEISKDYEMVTTTRTTHAARSGRNDPPRAVLAHAGCRLKRPCPDEFSRGWIGA